MAAAVAVDAASSLEVGLHQQLHALLDRLPRQLPRAARPCAVPTLQQRRLAPPARRTVRPSGFGCPVIHLIKRLDAVAVAHDAVPPRRIVSHTGSRSARRAASVRIAPATLHQGHFH